MEVIETDVLVVGVGPCGLTASSFLATYGVNVIALSRYSGPAPNPRGHITNMRTMEVFRDLGVEERVAAIANPLQFLHLNVYGTSLAGKEIARYKSYGTRVDLISEYAAASPCDPYNAPQHYLEPTLLEVARERGVDVRYYHELFHLEQHSDHVIAHIRKRDTGEEYAIRCKYLVGADGGRSTVAEQVGIEFEGSAGLQDMTNMWLAADLTKYTAHRPGVIYWMGEPGYNHWKGTGVWICVKPFTEWLFMSAVAPNTPEETLLEMARASIGDPDVEITLKGKAHWQINHVFAKGYRKGRVLVAGDAAHRHSPSGGLGTNTSVQDAFNLAWKLAYVVQGKAGDGLLDSYSDERQPVGQFVTERSTKNFHKLSITEAIGYTADQSAEDGWKAIDHLFSDEPGAAERRADLKEIIKFQDYRSNAVGVELGQRYKSGAVIDDGAPVRPFDKDPELFYDKTTRPGACIPHAWVEKDTARISTLDIVGRGRMCLIIGLGGEKWRAAAEVVNAELGTEVEVCPVGYRCTYDDVSGEWESVREITDGGALLVRPDRFIAWRSLEMAGDPETALRDAFRQVLALT